MVGFVFFLVLFLNFSNVNSKNNEKIVLMYHRIDEPKHPSTSISLDLFKSQMQYLKKKNYIVDSIRNIKDFSDKQSSQKKVYITFDDGFLSIYKKAYPILSELKFPFSIFISTSFISQNNNNDFMNWKIIKNLKKNNVEIYSHGHTHESFLKMSIEAVKEDILISESILKSELNISNKLISFPYGESNESIKNLLRDIKYETAFGQHSGVINIESDFLNLPRFAINENFGNMKRFKRILNYSRLNTFNVIPLDSSIKGPVKEISFSSDKPLNKINCYLKNEVLEKIISDEKLILNLEGKLKEGRNRINCTFIDQNGSVYWHSRILVNDGR